ncbi:hypothetical protein AOX55_00001347 [Sinorhizobium fredii CCBAU 25509]|nr:hypothetical protein SF83666_c11140 [Sinorhizobium fredii CCBAU 83666]AWM24615.1 hypothetical protein AOX55_00001347 [Sinorhizobium fredii CCBAU 25509]
MGLRDGLVILRCGWARQGNRKNKSRQGSAAKNHEAFSLSLPVRSDRISQEKRQTQGCRSEMQCAGDSCAFSGF